MEKIWLGIICLIALFLNIYGIWGGIPSEERLKLLFSNKQEIKENIQVMKETRDEIYQKMEYYGAFVDIHTQDAQCEMVIEGRNVKISKVLLNSLRSFLLRSYYPDEQAVLAALGRMNPGKLDFDPHFYTYGGLYIYLVGAFIKIASILNLLTLSSDISYYFLHPDEMGKMFIAARLVGALVGVLAVYVIYLLASRLYNKRVGLIAALFMSFVPAIVVDSHYLKPYAFNIPFLLLSFYMAVKILSSDKISNYIWGGIFAGLAGGILITFGLIFISIPIAHLIKRISQKPKIKTVFSLFEKGIFLSIFASIITFILINPYMLISIERALAEFKRLAKCCPFDPGFGHALYFFKESLADGLGWPLLATASVGVLYSLHKRKKEDILILSFVFLAYFFISATKYQPFKYQTIHYGLWLIPFLILLGARVIGIGLEKGKITRYITLSILLVVSGYTFLYSLSSAKLFAEEDLRLTCGKWLVANIERGASVGYFGIPPPYAAPLINPFRYKIVIWQEKKGWGSDLPKYLVYKTAHRVYKPGRSDNERIFENFKPILKSQYKMIKKFRKVPKIFGIRLTLRDSQIWFVSNPTILIYEKKE